MVAALAAVILALTASSATAASFTSVTAGTDHSCAIREGGSVSCWGIGTYGQLGVIGAVRARTPLAVVGTYTAVQVSAGQAYWCALLLGGTVTCSGTGTKGQIGNGAVLPAQFPMPVSGLTGAQKVATGATTACAITGGGVVCWGDGARGQLGDGQLTTTPTATPVTVPGVAGATDLAVGTTHACAVAGGRVLCWGDTADGQLGTTNAAALAFAGEPVMGIADASAVSAGAHHSCAIRAGGTVWCWGRDDLGQLGAGTAAASAVPVQVRGLTGVTAISGIENTTCAIRGDGTVWCWGDGKRGQLGNGTTVPSNVPVQVEDLTGATSVSAGSVHACATTSDRGRTLCWGSNQYAQLGSGTNIGTSAREPTPQLVEDSPRGLATFVPTPLPDQSKTSYGGIVDLRLVKVTRRGSRCPTTARVILRARGQEVTRRAVDVERVRGACLVTGRFRLPPKTRRANSVVYLVRGDHLRTIKHRLKARGT